MVEKIYTLQLIINSPNKKLFEGGTEVRKDYLRTSYKLFKFCRIRSRNSRINWKQI